MALSPELREARCRTLVDAAHALIRDTGGTGFSMLELARRAGVSPATPYNLLGSKAEVLRRVIRDEYESFSKRLAALPPETPLNRLLHAVDLVVVHYAAEPNFYRGLYLSILDVRANDLRAMMTAEGQLLWCDMIRQAVDVSELARVIPDERLTALLLRTMGATVEAWLAEDWDQAQFAEEMFIASRTIMLGFLNEASRSALVQTLKAKAGGKS